MSEAVLNRIADELQAAAEEAAAELMPAADALAERSRLPLPHLDPYKASWSGSNIGPHQPCPRTASEVEDLQANGFATTVGSRQPAEHGHDSLSIIDDLESTSPNDFSIILIKHHGSLRSNP